MNLLQITDVALTTAVDSTALVAADVAEMNYWEMAKKGGPWIMIPLLILSIMAVYIFIERYVAIKKASKEDKTFMDRIKDYITEGKLDSATKLCQQANNPMARMIEKGISTGQLSVVISIDSSSRETYKKIKQVDAFNTVCKNLKKYSKAQKNSFNVISKYIIIPEVNDNKEEIDNWLKFNKENNIEIIVIDIENSWLTKYRNEEPDKKIVDLIKYVMNKSREMNFNRLEICDRAKYLVEN